LADATPAAMMAAQSNQTMEGYQSMSSSLRIRSAMALSGAVLALIMVTQPAFAFDVRTDTGTHGTWAFHDESGGKRGANCIYQSVSPYNLTSITVRFPVMYGRFSGPQKVGWSFSVERQDPLPQDPSQFIWNEIYHSSVVKSSATLTNPGKFSRRAWTAPAHPKHQYRVMVQMHWYKKSAPTVVAGSVTGRVEWYKEKSGTNSIEEPDYCLQEY
jgi:hypothetical protein